MVSPCRETTPCDVPTILMENRTKLIWQEGTLLLLVKNIPLFPNLLLLIPIIDSCGYEFDLFCDSAVHRIKFCIWFWYLLEVKQPFNPILFFILLHSSVLDPCLTIHIISNGQGNDLNKVCTACYLLSRPHFSVVTA